MTPREARRRLDQKRGQTGKLIRLAVRTSERSRGREQSIELLAQAFHGLKRVTEKRDIDPVWRRLVQSKEAFLDLDIDLVTYRKNRRRFYALISRNGCWPRLDAGRHLHEELWHDDVLRVAKRGGSPLKRAVARVTGAPYKLTAAEEKIKVIGPAVQRMLGAISSEEEKPLALSDGKSTV